MSARRTVPSTAAHAGQPDAGTRTYRSTLREERAADTRQRIVRAAGALFTERGFVETTVPLVAERAGVSQPTVYAVFGSKGGIVRALTQLLEDDADAAGWRPRINAEPDPAHKLELFARWSRQLYSTGRGLIAAIQDARGEPAIADLHAQGDRNRRQWLSDVITALAHAGALRPGLSETAALDRAWTLTGFELYFRTTDGCGWSDDAYERWLVGLLRDQLLRHHSSDPGTADETATTKRIDGPS